MACKICGTDDLFTACTDEGVCSICKMNFIGGLTATPDKIKEVRSRLGVADGEFYKQDVAKEAARILGRDNR